MISAVRAQIATGRAYLHTMGSNNAEYVQRAEAMSITADEKEGLLRQVEERELWMEGFENEILCLQEELADLLAVR